MKVFLKVAVNVWRNDDAQDPPSILSIVESVEEAIYNAIKRAEDNGYNHELAEEVLILFDYVEAQDTDMEDQLKTQKEGIPSLGSEMVEGLTNYRDPLDQMRFNEKLNSFILGCQAIIDRNHAENYPDLTPSFLRDDGGQRYLRLSLFRQDGVMDWGPYCFIDPTNGDVLSHDSYEAPDEYPMGNIFDEHNGLRLMGPYGTLDNED